jgi:hypothetical protein
VGGVGEQPDLSVKLWRGGSGGDSGNDYLYIMPRGNEIKIDVEVSASAPM